MSFEEKITWVNAMVTVIVATVYFWIVGSQLGETPVDEIAYQRPMIIALGAIMMLTIIGVIVTAIGTAIGSEITGEGSVEDIDRKDERDVYIGRRGDLVAYYVSSALFFGVLVLTMLEYPYFWIANGMLAAFLIAGLVSATVKLVFYRRGF